MENEKYTAEGLPIVTSETISSLRASSTRNPGIDDTINREKEIFKMQQRHLATYLAEHSALVGRQLPGIALASGWTTQEIIEQAYQIAFVEAYVLMRRQAQANKLEETL